MSDTPRTDALIASCVEYGQVGQLTDLARDLERERNIAVKLYEDCGASLIVAKRENARLREALIVALPLMDAWLNGDGINIDMNEWDAAVMLARAALVSP